MPCVRTDSLNGHGAENLLITGTVGVGKTTVAEAVGRLREERSVPHAVVDLDQIRLLWPSPDADRFNLAVELRNLASLARNYREAGAQRLIMAGVTERRSDLARYGRFALSTKRSRPL